MSLVFRDIDIDIQSQCLMICETFVVGEEIRRKYIQTMSRAKVKSLKEWIAHDERVTSPHFLRLPNCEKKSRRVGRVDDGRRTLENKSSPSFVLKSPDLCFYGCLKILTISMTWFSEAYEFEQQPISQCS